MSTNGDTPQPPFENFAPVDGNLRRAMRAIEMFVERAELDRPKHRRLKFSAVVVPPDGRKYFEDQT